MTSRPSDPSLPLPEPEPDPSARTGPEVATVIVAAGRGLRAGGGIAKQWRDLGGRTVLARSIAAFAGLGPVCLVLRAEEIGHHPEIEVMADLVVAGGAERAHSVRAGLEALEERAPARVLIHD
ncbi:2-C-methyl-D-erythritol 4-phosphate cytidylyltransferase, partial [Limimaricola sp. ASW11-118]|nr:2-C-methyl-D-erythritol 4-phosphate cytidylyltransferase [Limimaricola litoreus]